MTGALSLPAQETSTREQPAVEEHDGAAPQPDPILEASKPQADREDSDRKWYHVPLPLLGTSSLPPQTPGSLVEPLGRRGKVLNAIDRTVGPEALANRAFLAGINQWRTRPEEWAHGWDAYGQRYGYRMTRLAVRNGIMLGFDLALGTDQRYDRCACSGFLPRTGHAVRRVFLARTDSGGETINAARLIGAYGAPAVAYRMYPDRFHGGGAVLNSGTQYLLWRGISHVVREFWPEIHRVIRIGPSPTSRSID